MEGIIALTSNFLKYLKKNKRRIAVVQLCGKIEDYLVKEFVYFSHNKSNGKDFASVNIGKKNQQKIDICMIKGDIDKPTIYGMIEAKYIRNRHRFTKWEATDEIKETMKSLNKQLRLFKNTTHGYFNVKLKARTKNIYGLVFVSYVGDTKNEAKKRVFFNKVRKSAKVYFRHHDLPELYLSPAYDDVEVKILNKKYYVSLYAGLWMRK